MFTMSLEKLATKDSYIAGSKAAFLGEVKKLGMNVPKGFVLFSYAFDTFLNYHALALEIFSIINSIDFENERDLDEKSEKIKKLIIRKRMPEEIEREIFEKCKKLKIEKIAVRSSFISEDSLKNSWAGQAKSILGSTEKTLIRDIKKVWASSFSSHVLKYRRDRNLEKISFSLAVIIQELLDEEVSGISFSVDPFSGNAEVVLTEVVIGEGKLLAYGKVIPHKYIVEKGKGELINFQIGRQKQIIVLPRKQGRLFESDQSLIIHQLLSQEEIETFSWYIIKLEKFFNFPVDVEWLKTKSGDFYIVQVRPMTAICNNVKGNENMKYTHIKKFFKPILAFSVMEVWHRGEYFSQNKLDGVFVDPLFVYYPKKGFNIYYHKKSIKSNPIELLNYYRKNWNFGLRGEIDKFLSVCDRLEKYLKNPEEQNIPKMLDLLIIAWPEITNITTILSAISNGAIIDPEIEKTLEIARIKSEKIPHNAFGFILGEAEKYYQDSKRTGKIKYISDFLVLDEIRNKKYKKEYPAILKQVERNDPFVYYRGNFYFGEQMKQLIREKIKIDFSSKYTIYEKSKNDTYLGTPIFPGKVSGKIKKIFNYHDLSRIMENDIIIAPDIAPEYSKIIGKVSGIITEEGGELSHTAIIAREYKKPCIVGVQGITNRLSDGQKIEMDGSRGIVRII